MIRGLGIDAVEIARFAQWNSYSQKSLRKIFSEQEIIYCLESPVKSAERFAVRFAAREAFFKASASLFFSSSIPFLFLCKKIYIQHTRGAIPELVIDWAGLGVEENIPHVSISLTHTHTTAVAVVVLENIS